MKNPKDNTDPTKDFHKALNVHGHGFQYAVLKRTSELIAQSRCQWFLEVAEFPVGVDKNITHIDFVLRTSDRKILLVAECKRVDPARARWCFVQTPYTRRNSHNKELVFQQVTYKPPNEIVTKARTNNASIDACNLAIELKTKAKGEGFPTGAAIMDAATQVLRGLNGLVDHMFPPHLTIDDQKFTIFLPVIFTTAELWVASGDLGSANLETGTLKDDWATLKQVKWLWYTYNQSPALMHHNQRKEYDTFNLSETLHSEFSRTIAIVGTSGIDDFLSADLHSWLLH